MSAAGGLGKWPTTYILICLVQAVQGWERIWEPVACVPPTVDSHIKEQYHNSFDWFKIIQEWLYSLRSPPLSSSILCSECLSKEKAVFLVHVVQTQKNFRHLKDQLNLSNLRQQAYRQYLFVADYINEFKWQMLFKQRTCKVKTIFRMGGGVTGIRLTMFRVSTLRALSSRWLAVDPVHAYLRATVSSITLRLFHTQTSTVKLDTEGCMNNTRYVNNNYNKISLCTEVKHI